MADAGPGPCAPGLTLMAERPGVLPYEMVRFIAGGGTGAYRFSFVRNVSGGIINGITGAYLAGPTPGALQMDGSRQSDEVAVTDEGCVGRATATVTVVPPMQVRPTSVELPPGGSFTFQVVDGLGPFQFEMLTNAAGGTVSAAGQYAVAAGTSGRDRIRVRDMGGGTTVDATIDVVAGATLQQREGTVFIPVGATYRPVFAGGSGYTSGVVMGGAVTYVDGLLAGVMPGSATVSVTDQFTGQATSLSAVVMAPQDAPAVRAGDQSSLGWVERTADVTGDGRPDALLGLTEADVAAVNSGAVYLYESTTTGLAATPRQVLSGVGRADQFGRQVATADFNGDGRPDLLVAAPLGDVGAADTGSLTVHYALSPDGGTSSTGPVWSDAPGLLLAGRNGGDNFGTSFAVCDFNADGRLDIAVGAPLAEDRTASPQAANQGGVFIFLGYPDGFLGTADQVLWGTLPDAMGAWAGSAELRIGNALAAGDFDGDGACDLAAGALNYRFTAARSSDGAVFIYKGVPRAPMVLGGLQPLPSFAVAGIDATDTNTNAGRYLAMGDVNGDMLADLVVSQYLHDSGMRTDRGAVRLFTGRMLPTLPPMALAAMETADWTAVGPNASDNFGWWVHAADANADNLTDVITGNLSGEAPDGGTGNAGSLSVFHGVHRALPATTPDVVLGGLVNGDRFGQNSAIVGDLDGDTTPDYLVFAARQDDNGVDVGTPYFVPGNPASARVKLDMPYVPSGNQLGRSADVVGDVNGDNRPDLLVGAPQDDPAAGVNAGAAFLYLGQMGGGFSSTPDLVLQGHFTGLATANSFLHSGSDQFGFTVTRAGDFDGDAVADFAVVARSEDRPSAFTAANVTADGMCAGTRNDAGAVFVYRGSATGLPSTTPAFVYFGPQSGQVIEVLTGGLDINNDGLDDLVLGSISWDGRTLTNTGGFAVVLGRAPSMDGKPLIICAEDLLWYGLAANDQAGRSVAPLGDLNADGCDDFAVGSALEDLGRTDQGTVRVVYGWGGTGCPMAPTAAVMIPDVNGANAGISVGGGGVDVDGDMVPDLAVGGTGLRNGANTTGGAWVVPGAYINTLPRVPLDETTATNARPLVDPMATGTFMVLGVVNTERAGAGVDLVPGVAGGGLGALVMGRPSATTAGVPLAGGATVHAFVRTPMDQRGLTGAPLASMGGETGRAGGRVGEWVRAFRRGVNAYIAVGGFEASGVGVDRGTAYVMRLPVP